MKRLIFLTVLILTIGLLPLLVHFRYIGFLDFVYQQVPFILETKRMFSTGTPWWSWNTFSGDNFIASYSFYTVTSPFVWIICLFPASKLWWGILFALYLKTIATSVFSYLYFRKMSFNAQLSTLGGLLYSFSSFYICNLYYYHFCEPILVFPLLMIGIESVIRNERYSLIKLSLATFLILFVNFYFACGSLLLGLIYFAFRCRAEKSFSKPVIGKYVIGNIVGALLSFVILIPMFMHLWGGARIEMEHPVQEFLGFEPSNIKTFIVFYLLRLRAILLPVITERFPNDFIISGNIWLSNQCFIQVFGLLGALAYMLKRRDWLTWLIVFLLICYVTPLNGVFTLFTNPMQTRWLYGLTLFIILATLYVIRDNITVSKPLFFKYLIFVLLVITLIIVSSVYSLILHGREFDIDENRYSELAVILINLICLSVWTYRQNNKVLTVFLVSICSVANLMAASYLIVIPIEYRYYEPFRKRRAIIIETPYEGNQKMMQYRYEESTKFDNTNMYLNRPGIYSFHSVYNVELLPFRAVTDSILSNPRNANNISSRESVAALMSVKEVLGFTNGGNEVFDGCLTYIKGDNDFSYYTFDYYIPMGFTYDAYVTKEKVDALDAKADSIDVPLMMLENLVINPDDEEIFSQYLKEGILNLKVDIDSVSKARRATTVSDFIGDSQGFTCNSDFDKTEVVFFSVAADRGFTATIDGKPTKIYNVNLGMSAIIVPAGKHEIVFRYFTPGLKFGAIVSLVAALILLCIWIYTYRHKKST